MAEALRPFVVDGRVRHVRNAVVSVRRACGAWIVRDDAGDVTDADLVVIATTHPSPTPPSRTRAVARRSAPDPGRAGRRRAEPTGRRRARASRRLGADGGRRRRHARRAGTSRADRHDLAPWSAVARPRAAPVSLPEGDFVSDPARTASALVRKVRRAVRRAEAEGRTWHPVLDAVRAQGASIWRALTPEARKRVVRTPAPVLGRASLPRRATDRGDARAEARGPDARTAQGATRGRSRPNPGA